MANESVQEAPATPIDVSPDAILEIGNGFRAAKLLFAASELGLFEQLVAGPATLDELAARMAIAPPRLRVLVDALVILGLVERHGGAYRNSPVAAAYLSGQTGTDLRPALRFWDRLSYSMFTDLADVLRNGRTRPRLSEEDQRVFSEGVAALTASAALALATTYDFSRHRRALDLGGGTGNWLLAILRRYSHLKATLFEQPRVAAIARQRLADDPAGRAVAVVEGDFLVDPIPAGHDAILLANVLHGGPAERSVPLLRRIRAAAPDGARLLLADGWTDPTRTRPPFMLIYASELMVHGGNRGIASEDDVRAWLRASGWRPVERALLSGPQSLIVAEAAELPR